MLENLAEVPLQKTEVENLWLLASGPTPPNPADLLGTGKMDTLIASLLERTDIVLFDAPPVAVVTDAAILGSKVDGVLLVIQSGKTRRDHSERAKELLEKAKVRVIGATLTNAPKDSAVGDYYE
jgi:non-specific protein-tyrosine kinase